MERLGDNGFVLETVEETVGLCGDTACPWLPYEGEGRLLKLTGGAVGCFGFAGRAFVGSLAWDNDEGWGVLMTVVFFLLICGPLCFITLVLKYGIWMWVNSGLTSHQQQGHTETGPWFKISSKDQRSGGSILRSLDW